MLLQKAPEGEDTKGSGVIAKVADFGLAQVGVLACPRSRIQAAFSTLV